VSRSNKDEKNFTVRTSIICSFHQKYDQFKEDKRARIILRWILKKLDLKVWTGFILPID
jgi:hypothetical protein